MKSNYTFDRNGALRTDVKSIFKNPEIKKQIKAAKKVAELHRTHNINYITVDDWYSLNLFNDIDSLFKHALMHGDYLDMLKTIPLTKENLIRSLKSFSAYVYNGDESNGWSLKIVAKNG